jgi:hypothetical protein
MVAVVGSAFFCSIESEVGGFELLLLVELLLEMDDEDVEEEGSIIVSLSIKTVTEVCVVLEEEEEDKEEGEEAEEEICEAETVDETRSFEVDISNGNQYGIRSCSTPSQEQQNATANSEPPNSSQNHVASFLLSPPRFTPYLSLFFNSVS